MPLAAARHEQRHAHSLEQFPHNVLGSTPMSSQGLSYQQRCSAPAR